MKKLFLLLLLSSVVLADDISYPSSAEVKTVDSWDAFVSATFLLWQARQNGVDLGYLNNPGNNNDAILPMNFSYYPAFKVKIGKTFSYDDWALYGQYTRYYGKDKKSAKTGDDSFILLNGDYLQEHVLEASSYWQLKFNLLDLRLQRIFYVGKHLLLAPVMALKACWINQHYHVLGIFQEHNLVSDAYASSWGLGPSGGFITNWILKKGFYLFNEIYVGAFYQKFKTSWHEQNSVHGDYGILFNKSMLNVNFEDEAGIGWGTYFNRDRWHYNVYFSYNFLAFGEQNMMRYLMDVYFDDDIILAQPVISNLYFQGLNIAMQFDF